MILQQKELARCIVLQESILFQSDTLTYPLCGGIKPLQIFLPSIAGTAVANVLCKRLISFIGHAFSGFFDTMADIIKTTAVKKIAVKNQPEAPGNTDVIIRYSRVRLQIKTDIKITAIASCPNWDAEYCLISKSNVRLPFIDSRIIKINCKNETVRISPIRIQNHVITFAIKPMPTEPNPFHSAQSLTM